MKMLAVLLMLTASVAQDSVTFTATSTQTVRAADPDEKVAIGGKIYTVREITELHTAITKFIQDLQATPKCTSGEHLYFVSYPYGITMQVCATGRLEAAVNSGITVWTENEWKERQARTAASRKDGK